MCVVNILSERDCVVNNANVLNGKEYTLQTLPRF